jgi:hypothetical protein
MDFEWLKELLEFMLFMVSVFIVSVFMIAGGAFDLGFVLLILLDYERRFSVDFFGLLRWYCMSPHSPMEYENKNDILLYNIYAIDDSDAMK